MYLQVILCFQSRLTDLTSGIKTKRLAFANIFNLFISQAGGMLRQLSNTLYVV